MCSSVCTKVIQLFWSQLEVQVCIVTVDPNDVISRNEYGLNKRKITCEKCVSLLAGPLFSNCATITNTSTLWVKQHRKAARWTVHTLGTLSNDCDERKHHTIFFRGGGWWLSRVPRFHVGATCLHSLFFFKVTVVWLIISVPPGPRGTAASFSETIFLHNRSLSG
jgi:hypothetical protein